MKLRNTLVTNTGVVIDPDDDAIIIEHDFNVEVYFLDQDYSIFFDYVIFQ